MITPFPLTGIPLARPHNPPLKQTQRPEPRRVALGQRALTLWARLAIGGFYRNVRVAGDPETLRDRPAVIAINHSNALGDIAVMIDVLPQFPRFLAASTWWRHAPVRLLFRLGRVLPVDRRGDRQTGDGNGHTFADCHDALAAGDHIAIFPEGKLNSGSALLPFRTGAARIALSAAANVGIPGVAIVPVAIAYEDRGRLGSDVVVRFGEPIAMDGWVAQAGANPVDTAHEVTQLLRERLAAAYQLGIAGIEATDAGTVDRNHRMAQLAVLAPAAAVGVVVNATAIAPIMLGARLVGDEGWQATAKGVGATVLVPVTWMVGGRLLAKRYGAARAAVLIAAGVGSGWVSIAWLGLLRELDEQPAVG